MRYAVTGAAGFIGSQLAETLIAVGHEVIALDCFTDYYDTARKEENARELDIQRFDLAADELDFSDIDAVYHLAGQPGARSFGDVFPVYVRRNVVATQRVFEAAVAAGVPVVWASSSSVYGDAERYPTSEDAPPRPNNPYGVTKLCCEQLHDAYARVFGLRAVALRYFTVYGPRQRPDMAFARIVDALARDEEFEIYGDGSQTSGVVHLCRRRGQRHHRRDLGCAGRLQRRWWRGGERARRARFASGDRRARASHLVRPEADRGHGAYEG